MKGSVLGGTLAIGLAALGVGLGCSEERGAVHEEMDAAAEAAREGAAASAGEAALGLARDAAEAVDARGAVGAAEAGVDAAADETLRNLDTTTKAGEEAYDEARKRGEKRIEAAGEAYDAALEVPEEKQAE